MAVFVTGDIHGGTDIRKLMTSVYLQSGSLTRDDYLIILGDFGLFWTVPPTADERRWLDWLERQAYTTLWVDGNHENHDLIGTLPVSSWNGGHVQADPRWPHVLHLMRGEVFDLPTGAAGELARCFVMGGATSVDRMWRTEGLSWWAGEMPGNEEYERATANLERVGFSVDYVLTHTCPVKVKPTALLWDWRYGTPKTDELEGYLQWVDDHLDQQRLKVWYFGHYHWDGCCDEGRHAVLFDQVIRLGDLPEEV